MGPALQPQTCLRVFTGSALPHGTSAVIMQEDTQMDPLNLASIQVLDVVKPWENVRLRGEDVKQGEQVLSSGERLNPQTMVWLELNLRTGLYADPEQTPVPESESQGAFTFGQACAKAVLANGGENKHIMKAKTRRGP